MRTVTREEILDYQTYGDRREGIRAAAMAAKDRRRVHVGTHLTFLFENRTTVAYQVQEMMRSEQMVREEAIRHELDTYNELLGGPGELGCTLLVEVADPQERAQRLVEWRELPRHLYALLADGRRVRPTWDERQLDDHRLSSVQFLKFAVGKEPPVALGSDLPALAVEAPLSPDQRAALAEDLAG